LFAFGIGYNPTCNRTLVSADHPALRELRKLVGSERVMPLNADWNLYKTPKAVLPPNLAPLYGLYDVQGYDSLYTRRYKDFADGLQGEDSSPVENGNILFFKSWNPKAARLARFIISARPIGSSRLRLIKRGSVFVYENPDSLPFAALSSGTVTLTRREANQVVLNVRAHRPGRLTVAQLFYPGWRGYIDGKPVAVYNARMLPVPSGYRAGRKGDPANMPIFQSVDIPAGRHQVRLSFEPGSVRRGYWLAIAGAILAAGAAAPGSRGRRAVSRRRSYPSRSRG